MKKNLRSLTSKIRNILVPLFTLIIFTLSSIAYAAVIENAINEKHQVSLVSSIYSINKQGASNITNYIEKGASDVTFTITKKLNNYNNENIDMDYCLLALPNGGTLESGVVINNHVDVTTSGVNTNSYTLTGEVSNKTCVIVVIPYLKNNKFVSSFEELRALNLDYHHMITDNDSAITDYNSLADVYASTVYNEIYLLNDITVPYSYRINIPCSIHLLTNDIILNNNLIYEQYYKGTYYIDTISGSVVKPNPNPNDYSFTIHTPNASNQIIDLDSNDYNVDNSYIDYHAALSYAKNFFTNDILEVVNDQSIYYAVLFDNLLLPTRFYTEDIILNYYLNYNDLQTKALFNVVRSSNNQKLLITIEAKNSSGIVLGTEDVNVWVVGTSKASEDESFAKVIEKQINEGLNENTNKVNINISTDNNMNGLNSFLAYANRVVSIDNSDVNNSDSYNNKFVLVGKDILLEINGDFLTCTRNTFNGEAYIYVNPQYNNNLIDHDNSNKAVINLLTMTMDKIEEVIANDIGQIFFSTGNVYYEIKSEEEYQTTYHLDNVEYHLKEIFMDEENDTNSIIYEAGNLRVVNVSAVYNLLYTYILKVNISKDGVDRVISKEIVVPSSSTGSGEQNSIVSDLFTANFNLMSNFIGTSNSFSSTFANFYFEISNENSIDNYLKIYVDNADSSDTLFNTDGLLNDGIINKKYYFQTIDANIPKTDTVCYINAYVTDRDQYTKAIDLKNAYIALKTFDLRNGVYRIDGTGITTIYNASRTINITYTDGVVTAISSSDNSISMENYNFDLTTYSYDFVSNNKTYTSNIFYSKENVGTSITVFLQQYSFIIPGIYQSSDFGSNLYSSLMDQYGYFEEILPNESTEEKERYLLANDVESENDQYTNIININYETNSNTVISIDGVKEDNDEFNIKLDGYFYVDNNQHTIVFYNSQNQVIDNNVEYNLSSGLFKANGEKITTIYKDISSSSIGNLKYLVKTKKIVIKEVTVSSNNINTLTGNGVNSFSNSYLEELVMKNCNIANSTYNFSKLQSLSRCDLSYNNLVTVPTFGSKLVYLDLSHNIINNITNIKTMYALEHVYLNNNQIDVFLPLTSLEELEEVNISSNTSGSSLSFDNETMYGSTGKLNVCSLVTLIEKGVNVTNDYLPEQVGNKVYEYEACLVINAIVYLSSYHNSFSLDLSNYSSYNLVYNNSVSTEITLTNSINVINGNSFTEMTNTNNVFSFSGTNGTTYNAIIKIVYNDKSLIDNPDNTINSATVYRLITFKVIN